MPFQRRTPGLLGLATVGLMAACNSSPAPSSSPPAASSALVVPDGSAAPAATPVAIVTLPPTPPPAATPPAPAPVAVASTGATPAAPTAAGGPPLLLSATVRIQGGRFMPPAIAVAMGGSVTFINQDAGAHTVGPGSGASFDGTLALAPNASGTLTFPLAGAQPYVGEDPSTMSGTISVIGPGTPAGVPASASPPAGPAANAPAGLRPVGIAPDIYFPVAGASLAPWELSVPRPRASSFSYFN